MRDRVTQQVFTARLLLVQCDLFNAMINEVVLSRHTAGPCLVAGVTLALAP